MGGEGGILHPIGTKERRSWNGNDSDMKERKETKTEEKQNNNVTKKDLV